MTMDTPIKEASYSGPSVRVSFKGLLFDMDGTIIDSTEAVVKHWHSVGKEIGVAPEVILQTSHGRRSIDMLKLLAPEKANWDYVCSMESRLPRLYGKDVVEIPGARKLISALRQPNKDDSTSCLTPPWAIVTSGTTPLVTGWLARLNLPRPEHLITAESVANGKPDPACYLLGLDSLQLRDEAGSVLVLEDSPAGIRAGKDAGCKVLGVVTSHTAKQVVAAGPDWIVRDLESVHVVGIERIEGGVLTTLEFRNTLVKP